MNVGPAPIPADDGEAAAHVALLRIFGMDRPGIKIDGTVTGRFATDVPNVSNRPKSRSVGYSTVLAMADPIRTLLYGSRNKWFVLCLDFPDLTAKGETEETALDNFREKLTTGSLRAGTPPPGLLEWFEQASSEQEEELFVRGEAKPVTLKIRRKARLV